MDTLACLQLVVKEMIQFVFNIRCYFKKEFYGIYSALTMEAVFVSLATSVQDIRNNNHYKIILMSC